MLKVNSFWSVNDKEVLTNVYSDGTKLPETDSPCGFLTVWNPSLKSRKQREQSGHEQFV